MKIHIIPILQDNYSYLLEIAGNAIVIDPGEAGPVIEKLKSEKLNLRYILNTHHHGDHIGGNKELKKKYGAKIAGPDDSRILDVDIVLKEGDKFSFTNIYADIIETPGHTRSHICFYFPDLSALFTGDTLFSLGCGRLFEGTADQMWDSLQKIMALPDQTKIYCGHEYTLQNAAFNLYIEPENQSLKNRIIQAEESRNKNLPTIPSTIGLEKKTNVFLRAGSAAKFEELREFKDSF